MKLSDLMPDVPDEIESGLRFTIESQYGMLVVFVEEIRERAAYDSANESYMYRLKQSLVLMLKPFGSDMYYIDGPKGLVKEIQTRARLAKRTPH